MNLWAGPSDFLISSIAHSVNYSFRYRSRSPFLTPFKFKYLSSLCAYCFVSCVIHFQYNRILTYRWHVRRPLDFSDGWLDNTLLQPVCFSKLENTFNFLCDHFIFIRHWDRGFTPYSLFTVGQNFVWLLIWQWYKVMLLLFSYLFMNCSTPRSLSHFSTGSALIEFCNFFFFYLRKEIGGEIYCCIDLISYCIYFIRTK